MEKKVILQCAPPLSCFQVCPWSTFFQDHYLYFTRSRVEASQGLFTVPDWQKPNKKHLVACLAESVRHSTTSSGKLFQVVTTCSEKKGAPCVQSTSWFEQFQAVAPSFPALSQGCCPSRGLHLYTCNLLLPICYCSNNYSASDLLF